MRIPVILFIVSFFGLLTGARAQHVYQIRADSVRIYNVCDTAELIIENRTRGVSGFLYNKNNGRTEFRKIDLVQIGGSKLAIAGQDTIDLLQMSGVGGIDTLYRFGDSIRYVKRGIVKGMYAPVNDTISLPGVLANGNKANDNIQLGAPGVTNSLNYLMVRSLSGVNYTGSMGLGIDMTSLTMTVFNGVDSLRKLFYIPFNGTGPMYSGNNGTTKFKLWHSGNDGVGSGLDADVLDGMAPDINATASTIAQRNITGQLFASYFNTTAPIQTLTPTKIFGSNDGYIRALDAASVRGFLGMPASGDDLQSVTDRGNVSVRNGENLTIKKAAATAGDLFIRFRNSDNSERGYIGYGSSVNNTFVIHNADNSPTRIMQRLLVNNPSEDDSTSGLQVKGPSRFGGVLLQNGFSPNPENNTINQFWNSMGGAMVTPDPEFRRGLNGLSIYNNVGSSNAVVIERTNAVLNAAVPNSSGYYLKVTSTPGAPPNNIMPGLGGIRLNYRSAENKVYVTRIRALIPVGYNLMQASNLFGTNSYHYWMTGNKGTGKWEDYIHIHAAGNAGTFETIAYYYLEGDLQPTSWYVGYFDFRISSTSTWTENVLQNLTTGRPSELYLHDDSTQLTKGAQHSLRVTTPFGYLDAGAQNSTHMHFATDRQNFVFTKPVVATDKLAIYNNGPVTSSTTYLAQTEGRINNSPILTEASAATGFVRNQNVTAQAGYIWMADAIKSNTSFISRIGIGHAAFRLHNSADALRFGIGLANTESANAGSDLHIWKYDDAGAGTIALTLNRLNGYLHVPGQVHSGNGSRIVGDGSGAAFYSWLGFYDNANRRYGYVGKGGISNVDMQIASDSGNIHIITKGGNLLNVGSQELSYNGGTFAMKHGTSNNILFAAQGVGAPTVNTRSIGTKIIVSPSVGATTVDYGIGMESNNLWFSTSTTGTGFKWYGGANNIATLTGAGNLTLSGSATATAFYQSSLRSLKKDIQPFSVSALDVLGKAQVRTFRFKADSTGHRNIGFIADEVPDEMATPGRNGVDQASTVGLLVKAVQELKAEKDQLSAENKALADRLKKLEAAMDNILKQQKAGK